MAKVHESLTQATSLDGRISHGTDSRKSDEDLLQRSKSRLKAGDLPGGTIDQQIGLLEESYFLELGRFLLESRRY
ncbi:hypothetical protein [Paraburkholderia hospita]|uniref:hypothetical protein n=1 Tax=Paraburkholderia hospita TaxID=169430 RepID=UPI000DEF8532|nr:hypothetical protein [Paraburkholderia hospita]AXF05497.1 hypothetical protein CUJ88_44140 [Paraburkholderia hospita]